MKKGLVALVLVCLLMLPVVVFADEVTSITENPTNTSATTVNNGPIPPLED